MMKSKGNRKFYYLDNAAAAPIDPEVQREMDRGMKIYGNPSSFNNAGRQALRELSIARLKIARFLGAHQEEIIFTSSGSEANNMAIFGIIQKLKFLNSKPHLITTQIEHPSVLEPIRHLEIEGFDVTYLSVDKEGFIDLDEFKNALRTETVLVSIMYANNEIGTIEPINRIAKIISDFCKRKLETRNSKLETNSKLKIQKSKHFGFDEKFPIFHIDACQAAGYLNMNVNSLQADLLTFNGSKIGGPRGIGVLYLRKGVSLAPFILGGGQEKGLRAGTENLPAILGLAKAVELTDKKEVDRLVILRDYFISKIKKINPEIKVNGSTGKDRLPNNINISIPKLDSENLLLELDKYGIAAGSGSACTSHAVEPSHVIKALAVDNKYLSGVIRFSLGRQTKKGDVDYVLNILPKVIKTLKTRYLVK